MMAGEQEKTAGLGGGCWLYLPSVDGQMEDTLSVQSQARYSTGSSDRVLPLGDRCSPGAPRDITKGALNARAPAHYYTYLSRLELGLLLSKRFLRLPPHLYGLSPPAEPLCEQEVAQSCRQSLGWPQRLNGSQMWCKFSMYSSQEKNR